MNTITKTKGSHISWECIYHVVIVPKYRKKVLYKEVRKIVWKFLRTIAERLWVEIVKWNLQPDHIHMVLKIPPKYSVAKVIWTMKWKTAIMLHNEFWNKKKSLGQKSFWSRWYFVRTIWLDKEIVLEYVKNQNDDDKYYDWDKLDFSW